MNFIRHYLDSILVVFHKLEKWPLARVWAVFERIDGYPWAKWSTDHKNSNLAKFIDKIVKIFNQILRGIRILFKWRNLMNILHLVNFCSKLSSLTKTHNSCVNWACKFIHYMLFICTSMASKTSVFRTSCEMHKGLRRRTVNEVSGDRLLCGDAYASLCIHIVHCAASQSNARSNVLRRSAETPTILTKACQNLPKIH